MSPIISIFKYTDPIQYLKDWRAAAKEQNPGISLEYLKVKLNQKSRSYYNDLEQERKSINQNTLELLCELFEFNNDEQKYFRALVEYHKSLTGTKSEREYWFEQMIQLNHTPYISLTKEKYDYYNNWYHSAIRAYLDLVDITSDYSSIPSVFKKRITLEQVSESIDLLLSLELIAYNEDGFLKPVDKVLVIDEEFQGTMVQRFNLSYHQLLKEVLEENTPGTYNSCQMMVSVSDSSLKLIEKRLAQLRSEIRSIGHKDEEKATKLINISMHAFTITEGEESCKN